MANTGTWQGRVQLSSSFICLVIATKIIWPTVMIMSTAVIP